MLHIVKWLQRHYPDQSEFMVVVLVVLCAAALMIGVALLLLE